jgi:hypothetical protein
MPGRPIALMNISSRPRSRHNLAVEIRPFGQRPQGLSPLPEPKNNSGAY